MDMKLKETTFNLLRQNIGKEGIENLLNDDKYHEHSLGFAGAACVSIKERFNGNGELVFEAEAKLGYRHDITCFTHTPEGLQSACAWLDEKRIEFAEYLLGNNVSLSEGWSNIKKPASRLERNRHDYA